LALAVSDVLDGTLLLFAGTGVCCPRPWRRDPTAGRPDSSGQFDHCLRHFHA
jgi:hypothetical protein